MEENLDSDYLEEILYRVGREKRWLQNSPVLPNVWKAFARDRGQPVDVIITPNWGTRPGQLAEVVREMLGESSLESEVAQNKSVVVASVSFEQLITVLLPLSDWGRKMIERYHDETGKFWTLTKKSKKLQQILSEIDVEQETEQPTDLLSPLSVWWLRLIGYISLVQDPKLDPKLSTKIPPEAIWNQAKMIFDRSAEGKPRASEQPVKLFQIALNRTASTSSEVSNKTIKADAARSLFNLDTSEICWAVLDTGIDALHPAFLKAGEKISSRVRESYDFTRVRRLISLASTPGDEARDLIKKEFSITATEAQQMRTSLVNGGDINWESLRPALLVERTEKALGAYAAKLHPHGTHVAGILGGRPMDRGAVEKAGGEGDENFTGACPDIQLIDIRILDQGGQSKGPRQDREFDTLAALQFVDYLNSASNMPVVHGINLSIQLKHDPSDYACGRTPVCDECNHLVASGVVVVAAAGNLGIDKGAATANTTRGAFRSISIADPGNAESVITVGSTHRRDPHTYGVSFFSSRGPTGDGRQKPDIVAPGEKVLGPVPGGGFDSMHGTSQAAPYVSAAAAMILSRHRELIGQPARVKQILCETATDLGRERRFQGEGLVDILRALQSI